MAAPILVVDDSGVNRVLAEAKPREEGHRVTCAADGAEEVITLLQLDGTLTELPYDAVILDIMMTEIDGIEGHQKIRAAWNLFQLPVIMATAEDDRENMQDHRSSQGYALDPG